MDLSACKEFAQKIVSDPPDLLHGDPKKSCPQTRTCCTIRCSIPPYISNGSTVSCLVRNLTNWEQDVTDFLHSLSWFSFALIFYWLNFYEVTNAFFLTEMWTPLNVKFQIQYHTNYSECIYQWFWLRNAQNHPRARHQYYLATLGRSFENSDRNYYFSACKS